MLGTRTLRDRSSSRDPDASQQPQDKKHSKDKSKERQRVDQWLEPALSKQPSYRDNEGGVSYGVSEYMQPLGEAPNARVKARVKADGARKSMLGKNAATGGVDGQDTPEGTPVPQTQVDADTNTPSQPRIVVDDTRDDDYAPAGDAKRRERATRPRAVKRHSRGSGTPGPTAQAKTPTTDSAAAKANRASVETKQYDAVKLKQVVNAAIERAFTSGRETLGYAVKEIYQQSLTNARLTELMEAVLLQTAGTREMGEFHQYVKAAKRKVKQERDMPGNANNAQSLPLRSPLKSTSTKKESSAIPSTEHSEPQKAKSSAMAQSASKERGRDRSTTSPSRKHSSTSPLKKRSSTSPTKKPASASPAKKRSRSADSDSSLTSMTSNPDDDMDVDEPEEITDGPLAPRSAVNGVKVKDHAAERGSLAAPSRNLKRSSADADLQEEERDRILAAKKQKLSETVTRDYAYEESSLRSTAASRLRSLRGNHGSLAPPTSSTANGTRSGSARGSRAVSTDADSPLSELSPLSSRQSTPQVHKGPTKPFGKRAKTKQSPEKKPLAGYSGMSGTGGASRESPIGDEDNEELSENNDYCSACGGSGFLLCCDGCDRSFHFSCLDPPLNEDASELNEPWFCYICIARRPIAAESPEKLRGLFAPLLNSLRKRNPSNFSLPQDIRDHFDGVATDRNGAFIEAVHPKTRNRPGYDEAPDYTKIKDGKGNTLLCYSCGKSSQGTRPIITCDYCGENWHLDCLDPPLANPPARNLEGKKVHDWMCPLHADHELRNVDTSLLNRPRIGRKAHIRKPRNAKLVEASLKRGFRNNGVIEVIDDASDDSESEFFDEESQDESVVYRLPASGIKLDFIDKVKSTRIQQLRTAHAYRRARVASAPRQLQQANFARRSFREQKIALNLAQFASAQQDLDLGSDQVENLVGTLIAEAPPEVVDGMTAAEESEKARSASSVIPPSPPASEQTDQLSAEQRRELQMLQELIKRRLESSKT